MTLRPLAAGLPALALPATMSARVSRVVTVGCDRIDVLVTDAGAEAEEPDRLREAGIGRIVVA